MSTPSRAETIVKMLRSPVVESEVDLRLTEGEYWLINHLSDLHHQEHQRNRPSSSNIEQ